MLNSNLKLLPLTLLGAERLLKSATARVVTHCSSLAGRSEITGLTGTGGGVAEVCCLAFPSHTFGSIDAFLIIVCLDDCGVFVALLVVFIFSFSSDNWMNVFWLVSS